MAAALGMILGAGATYLGTQARERRQLKHEADQHFLETIDDHLKQHPEDAATPEFAKYGKKIYGEHWEPMQQILGFAAQAKQKEQQQFQELTGGGGQPSSQPMMGASPTPGQGQPAAGSLPSPAASPQSQFKMPQSADEWEAYRHKLIQARGHFTDPAHLKALDDEISFAKDQTDKAEHHQEFEQTQARIVQNEQTMTALREQGMENSAEARATMVALRQSEMESQNQFRTIMLDMKQSEDKSQNANRLTTAVSSLQARAKAIAALPPDQFKPLLPGFNANVKMLKKQLTDAGMGDVADGIEPLKAETVSTWGGFGSAEKLAPDESGAATAPITATNDKGEKIQWDGKAWKPVK
jgi:hypothetical protein